MTILAEINPIDQVADEMSQNFQLDKAMKVFVLKSELDVAIRDILTVVKSHIDSVQSVNTEVDNKVREDYERTARRLATLVEEGDSLSAKQVMAEVRKETQNVITALVKQRREDKTATQKSFEDIVAQSVATNSLVDRLSSQVTEKVRFLEENLSDMQRVFMDTEQSLETVIAKKEHRMLKAVKNERRMLANQSRKRLEQMLDDRLVEFKLLPTQDDVRQIRQKLEDDKRELVEMIVGLREFYSGEEENRESALQEVIEQILSKRPVPQSFPMLSPGDDGSEWFFFDGTPDRSTGQNKDASIDVLTGRVYKKVDGDWVLQGQLAVSGGGGNSATRHTDSTDSGASDTYGLITPAPDGTTTVFTLGNAYATGTLLLYINGQLLGQNGNGFSETSPASGTITMDVAPPVGRLLVASYMGEATTSYGIDSTDVGDTYGSITPVPDGVATVFTVANGYTSGTLRLSKNGQLLGQNGNGFAETSPAAGTLTMDAAPAVGTLLIAEYTRS